MALQTLKQEIAADVTNVFFDEDEFAEDADFYPAGVAADKVNTTVIVHHDDKEGSREVPGDGRVLERDTGRKIRRSVQMDVPASLAVSDTREGDKDMIKLTTSGEIYYVKRIVGRDADVLTLLCVRTNDVLDRRSARRG